jgi:hypothetical protein
MPDDQKPGEIKPIDEKRPILSLLTSNWLCMLGAALVTLAGGLWLFLLPLNIRGQGVSNPYIGILIFLVVPAIFFVGLGLIPIGIALARRRIRSGVSALPDRRATLRRVAIFFGVMTLVNVVLGSQLSYRAVSQMESNQFCGQSCHVMKPQFTALGRTAHADVACVDCHIVPGAAGFVAAKINGTKQLLGVVLNNYPRPVPAALETGKLASSAETCEHCHSRTWNSGSPLRVIQKFKDDEMNTPSETVLTMNVGGGRFGGIHGAHMGPGIEIRYRADAKLQKIPWVEYRNQITGATSTYVTADSKQAGALEERVMECADCHNRSGHSFESPEEAVDGAMATGLIPASLPFAHKTAVETLKATYSSDEEAASKIPAAFAAFYAAKYPGLAQSRSAEISNAGKTLAARYARNVFSDLKVSWGTYPDNLGHADGAGCFRCHDESHATPEKKTITQDCNTCHQPIAVEETSPEVLKTLGLDQKLAALGKQ